MGLAGREEAVERWQDPRGRFGGPKEAAANCRNLQKPVQADWPREPRAGHQGLAGQRQK